MCLYKQALDSYRRIVDIEIGYWMLYCDGYTEFHWKFQNSTTMMFCVIRYNLYKFKNVKNTYGGVLLIVKL